MTYKAALVATLVMLSPAVAMASPTCTTAPKDKWMSENAMKSRIAGLGYTIKTFQVTGSCYEIYGFTKDKKRAEVYFNPVTGDVVKAEIDG